MEIKKAKEIIYRQEHQLDGNKRMNTQTVSQEYFYVSAKGFLEGYTAGVKEALRASWKFINTVNQYEYTKGDLNICEVVNKIESALTDTEQGNERP